MVGNKLISFITGTLFGMYVAQNYDVPNVKTYIQQKIVEFKELEEQRRINMENNNNNNTDR